MRYKRDITSLFSAPGCQNPQMRRGTPLGLWLFGKNPFGADNFKALFQSTNGLTMRLKGIFLVVKYDEAVQRDKENTRVNTLSK